MFRQSPFSRFFENFICAFGNIFAYAGRQGIPDKARGRETIPAWEDVSFFYIEGLAAHLK
jgi:hypothetical protein